MTNVNTAYQRLVADCQRAVTRGQALMTRRRNQFESLVSHGDADRAALLHAKDRFGGASDALGSDLSAYALIQGVDLGAD